MGNSKLRQSSNGGEGESEYDDVQTVGAIASVSDYNNYNKEGVKPKEEEPPQPEPDERAALDAVEEGDVEMSNVDNGTT